MILSIIIAAILLFIGGKTIRKAKRIKISVYPEDTSLPQNKPAEKTIE
jgi:hypothetical protein